MWTYVALIILSVALFATLSSLGFPSTGLAIPKDPARQGNLTLHRKPVSLLLLAANGAAMF